MPEGFKIDDLRFQILEVRRGEEGRVTSKELRGKR